jgi:sugar phosphate isomerase/epimerase
MKAIVGYTGFVGSNLLQFYAFDKFYNSKNFEEAMGKHFEEIIFCGIPAVKWFANKNPNEDANIIKNIKNILNTITCDKFILISTIDVYDKTNCFYNEDSQIHFSVNHAYGKNRYLFEKYIEEKFENRFIIRLPALFGKGLKKNIIFDLINNNQIENIPFNSSFQWYNVDRLKNDIDIVVKNRIKICNLFTEPIETKEIVILFDKIYKKDDFLIKIKINDGIHMNNNRIEYDTQTQYYEKFNSKKIGYICEREAVLKDLETFLKYMILNKSNLCVSNICVNRVSQLQFSCLLKLHGITKVQIAPTKLIGNWENLNNFNASVFTDNGIKPYSFQSITYGLDNLNIFSENKDKLMVHIKNIINMASTHKIEILVFGCPKNRKITNQNDCDSNDVIFINFFKELGIYCREKNVVICIENNSKEYNCNYINTIDECEKLVRQIDSSHVKMMVDLGNAIMEHDDEYNDLKNKMDIIHNIDIAEPDMKPFSTPHEANYIFKNILKHDGYNKNINLEMLIKNDENEIEKLNNSLINFINIYSTS